MKRLINTFSAVLMAVMFTCAFVVLVSAISLIANHQSSPGVALAILTVSISLIVWFVRGIWFAFRGKPFNIFGAIWVSLVVVGAFGLLTGFGLFDILSGNLSPNRMVLFVTSTLGLIASLITLLRENENAKAAETANGDENSVTKSSKASRSATENSSEDAVMNALDSASGYKRGARYAVDEPETVAVDEQLADDKSENDNAEDLAAEIVEENLTEDKPAKPRRAASEEYALDIGEQLWAEDETIVFSMPDKPRRAL